MKATLVALAFAVLPMGMQGQSLSPQLLTSAGGDFDAGDFRLEWSLGELAVTTIGDDPQLTQGFHQGDLKVGTAVVSPGFPDFRIYPNPVTDQFHIDIGELVPVEVEVYDLQGSFVLLLKANGPLVTVNAQTLIPGQYFARITSNGHFVATMKIQKFNL